ncbi:MAG: hypothetical protein IPN75_18550 [Dechloromonas sp.]|uniref:Uncharacterized protein n=1 Tax=Candidatus Dechloromonas phosphorivorans TaxID=2899244 RepID=A0A9D7LXX6_9RHOO|nr:hypothetical protein [Candidatus Dechloromonas phosphorivorans]
MIPGDEVLEMKGQIRRALDGRERSCRFRETWSSVAIIGEVGLGHLSGIVG